MTERCSVIKTDGTQCKCRCIGSVCSIHKRQQGKGIIENFKKLGKVRSIKDLSRLVVNNVKHDVKFVKDIIFKRSGFSPNAVKILDRFGGETITAIRIYRVPLANVLTGLFNVVTFGAFKKRMKGQDYDRLFHLRMDIRTNNNRLISIEKTEVVTLLLNPPTQPKSETLEVALIPNITINELVQKTRDYMGDKTFFGYSSKSFNCQHYCLALCTANGFITPELTAFIKQDTAALFDGYFRKLSNTVTDIAARADVVMQGGKVRKRKTNQSNLIRFER
jgi:hypothetical protein